MLDEWEACSYMKTPFLPFSGSLENEIFICNTKGLEEPHTSSSSHSTTVNLFKSLCRYSDTPTDRFWWNDSWVRRWPVDVDSEPFLHSMLDVYFQSHFLGRFLWRFHCRETWERHHWGHHLISSHQSIYSRICCPLDPVDSILGEMTPTWDDDSWPVSIFCNILASFWHLTQKECTV